MQQSGGFGAARLLRGQVDLPRVDHALRGVLDAKKRNAGAELQSVADEHRWAWAGIG